MNHDGRETKSDDTVAEREFMGKIVGRTVIFGEPDAEPLLDATVGVYRIELGPSNPRIKMTSHRARRRG